MTEPLRQSASLCLLRSAGDVAEVLMARRGAGARFMPGAWVFPGGALDDVDDAAVAHAAVGEVDPAHRHWLAAGAREMAEETGIWLTDPPRTVPPAGRAHGEAFYRQVTGAHGPLAVGGFAYLANWITPSMVPVRFDARFYVGEVPDDIEGTPDGAEIDAVRWIAPAAAVAAADSGEMLIAFPTRRLLLLLAGFVTPQAAVAYANGLAEVTPIQPKLVVGDDGSISVLVPGDPGFDEAPELPPDPTVLAAAPRVASATGDDIPELTRHAD